MSDDHPRVRNLELFLRYGSPFVTALSIALVGFLGQNYMKGLDIRADALASKVQEEETLRANEAQKQETIRIETVQNYRLYTELLSKREDAESALRRDMFKTILEKFFQVSTPEDSESGMDKQLLKLEMLALNFGESLSLSPLFTATDLAINKFPYPENSKRDNRRTDRRRLHSLAKRVADQQISALSAGGVFRSFTVPIKDGIIEGGSYNYPNTDAEEKDSEVELEGISRTYEFVFSQPNKKYKFVHVEIVTQEKKENGVLMDEVERNFKLNYFNFPMVDNTRLSSDQRFALILTNWADAHLEVTAITFPGKYSGQRDKPFLDDVIHRLQKNALNSSEDTDSDGENADPPAVGTVSTNENEESE
jgi:hypothetical protein